MTTTRLTALDTAFLAVETPTAHMHVGWAAIYDPPAEAPRPGFDELRDHIGSRLSRAPRYRQLLRPVPLGVNTPVWVDDEEFELSRHVGPAHSERLDEVVADSMSEPLPRDRPLWQMAIAPELDDGRIGLVGKAHHCMVDGIAAVELTLLLLDAEPEPPPSENGEWTPRPAPGAVGLLADGVVDTARGAVRTATLTARVARSPRRLVDLATRGARAARALAGSARPAKPTRALNRPNSPLRHLGLLSRPVEDLRQVKETFGTKLNDVILAASAGAVRSYLRRRGETPVAMKTMVPVNVREAGDAASLGNRISFIFVDLPCDEPDPERRLRRIHAETSERKRAGEPEGADDVVKSIGWMPGPLQTAVSRFVSSPRVFNLVVSNIPRPRQRLYMRGCELREAYPVVPLADGHALSIGVTNVGDRLCFGMYADRALVPDPDTVARDMEESIDELVELSDERRRAGGADRIAFAHGSGNGIRAGGTGA